MTTTGDTPRRRRRRPAAAPEASGWSRREQLVGGAAALAGAVMLGGTLLEHSASRLVTHPDDLAAHPVAQVQANHEAVVRVVEELTGFETAVAKLGEQLREMELERAQRAVEDESRKREFWLEQRQKDRDAMLQAMREMVQGGQGGG